MTTRPSNFHKPPSKMRILLQARRIFEMAVVLGSLAGAGCAPSGPAPADAATAAGASAPAPKKSPAVQVPIPTAEETAPFKLKPDWTGPCAKTDKVDVNLGHTPESFIRAVSCQISGKEPTGDQL